MNNLPSNYYVDKERLFEELKKYQKERKANTEIIASDYVGKSIKAICEGLAKRPNFNGYTFKDDMIGDGIEDCTAAIKNYNPRKSKNPFGYFSRIAWWAFVQRILIEKKQQYLKHKNYQNQFMLADIQNTENDSIEKIAWSSLSDQVIENFETNLKKNLTEAKKSGIIKNIKKGVPQTVAILNVLKETNNVEPKKNASGPGSGKIFRRRGAKRSKRSQCRTRARVEGASSGSHP